MKNFSIALPPVLAVETAPAVGNARPVDVTGLPCVGIDASVTPFDSTSIRARAAADSGADPRIHSQIGADREEIKDWLRLCHTPGVPPAAVRRLLTAFGPPAAIFGASRAALTDVVPVDVAARLLARTSPELHAQIALTLEWADRPGCAVVTLSEAAYPRALLTLGDPPPMLYCRGDAGLANRAGPAGARAAALVGSRRATPQGRDNARHFARVLGDAGVTVVSGLAAGIDAAAHEGALDTAGGTCAVIGTGADVVYPARHRALTEQIAARGLVLSAFPIGTPPRPEHFPRRNRLIAALARCTVVIEATTQSGSLITARLAGELGRDVLAVPGSIHAPQSRGCHVLIRDGATLAASPDDVLEAMGIGPQGMPPVHPIMSPEPTAPATTAVLKALGYDPVSADTLCERTGLSVAAVLSQLGVLELDGRIGRLPGGRFVRREAA
ncbi:DNA-processing protein DprA [Pandoraea sp. ISTKB]|uniref:DNA-processing protein DprA n=1 Tax=Pandoraea sp. ISTKB TaxID=1586708 RepID=UPI0009F6E985|nr:DNA-processing protein DprA [Pandoraea sp. ISTKB]